MPTDESSSAPSSSLPKFEVGQKLAGVYVLRDQIGHEPDGVIWVAHEEVLGKDVSLHFIPPILRSDERAMGEIRQEIKRNRQLIHPGILRVYDLVEEPDWSAISMDWFEGQSLAAGLKAKPGGFFEPSEVKAWLQQVCHTLDDIHKIQIVHRHVAPHNIFVDTKGKVLLAKFGISRVIEDALSRLHKSEGDAHLASLSPQCLDGENPSKADDIYSLGATIYELLTGELPFVGPDLVAQIRKNPPQSMTDRRAKLGKKGGTILPVWEKWVAAALAKVSTDRPASAGELAAKLGLSGKLTSEPLPVAAPAAPAETAAPAKAKAPEGKSAAETATAAAIAAIAAATSPEKASIPPIAKAPKEPAVPAAPAASTPAAPETAAEIKLPASPATAAAKTPVSPEPVPPVSSEAVTEKLVVGKPATEKAVTEPKEEKPVRQSIEKIPEKPPEELEDFELEVERPRKKVVPYAESERPGASPRSSALVFGGLIVLVAGLAYFLNRPEEPKTPSAKPVNAAASPAASPKPVATPSTPKIVKTTPAATPDQSKGVVGEPLLVEKATPMPVATPALPAATPKAVVSADNGNAPLFVASDDPQKDYLNAIKQKELADTALVEIQKAVKKKAADIEPIIKSSDQIQKDRADRVAQVKSAEDAATAAREAAEAKAKSLAEAKKAQSDWEAANAPKLVAIDKASAEFRSLQDSLEEKKKLADRAAQVAAAADEARQQKAIAARKKEEEAKKAAADAKMAEAKRLADEQARIAEAKRAEDEKKERLKQENADQAKQLTDQIAAMQAQLVIFQWKQEHPGEPVPAALMAKAAPPATPAPPKTTATPTPRAVATPVATPVPVATPKISTPPPAPPPPQPIRSGNVQNDMMPSVPVSSATPSLSLAGATPATALSLLTSPTPRKISSTPPATPAPEPADTAEVPPGESSLGLKFAPVGDVYFCLWPTRVKDFETFAKDTGFRGTAWRSPGFKQGPDHPVVNVSWNDAIAFCKWLTDRDRKKGALTKDQSYRLPTDLEWSRAVGLPEEVGKTPEARDMGVADVFPWGTQWPPPPNVGNYTGEETGSDVAIKGYEDGYAWTSPVGTFPPNKFGLYDVGGNVWQWCMDNWSAESKAKVLRGASWYNGALKLSLLSSCRVHANPDSSTDNYGFRIVRAAEPKTTRPPK